MSHELLLGPDGLSSPTCQCSRAKRPGQSFCRICYYRLPRQLRARLYDRVGEGYEQAHAAAIEHLKGAPPK